MQILLGFLRKIFVAIEHILLDRFVMHNNHSLLRSDGAQ